MRVADLVRRYGHSTGVGNVAPSFHSTVPVLLSAPQVGVAIGYTPALGLTGTPVPVVTQQWTLDGVDISGATGATYTPVSGDATHLLRVREIATNSVGSANATSASGTVAATIGPSVPGGRVALAINMANPFIYERSPGPLNWFMAVNDSLLAPATGGWEFDPPNRTGTVTLASDGWPSSDFDIVCWAGEEGTGVITLHGQFTGQASVAFYTPFQRGGSSMSAVSYNSGTNTSTFTFNYDPSVQNLGPELAFTNTKRTSASGLGSGVTNLYLWETRNVGNTTDRWDGARLASTILSDFTVLRTMDVQQTNNDAAQQDWGNRSIIGDIAGGRPGSLCNIEGLVNLANASGKDLWIQVPINASNDWIDHAFAYIFANINSSRKVYFAVGNESWNPGLGCFQQTVVNASTELRGAIGTTSSGWRGMTSAVRSGGVVTVTVNYLVDLKAQEHIFVQSMPSVTDGSYVVVGVTTNTFSFSSSGSDGSLGTLSSSCWMISLDVVSTLRTYDSSTNLYEMAFRWMIRRCVQASDRVRTIVGNSNMFTKYYPHVEEQAVSGDGFSTLSYVSFLAGGDSAVKTKIWALAGAPYFTLGADAAAGGGTDMADLGSSVTHTTTEFANNFVFSAAVAKIFYHESERASNCAHFGIRSIHYEGGPDVDWDGGTTNNVNKNAAKLTSTFGTAHLGFLKDMGMCGCAMHAHYQESVWDVGSNSITTWGFTDNATNVTPFWQSFKDYNAIADASLPSINPISSVISTPTVIDGSLCVGRFGVSTSYPGLHTPNQQPNNNKQDWLVTSSVTGTYNLVIAYACDFLPNDMSIEVNGVAVSGSTFTPTQTGTFPDLSGSHNSPTFSIPLLAGLNAVRVVALVNHGPNNNEAFKSLTFTRTA